MKYVPRNTGTEDDPRTFREVLDLSFELVYANSGAAWSAQTLSAILGLKLTLETWIYLLRGDSKRSAQLAR